MPFCPFDCSIWGPHCQSAEWKNIYCKMRLDENPAKHLWSNLLSLSLSVFCFYLSSFFSQMKAIERVTQFNWLVRMLTIIIMVKQTNNIFFFFSIFFFMKRRIVVLWEGVCVCMCICELNTVLPNVS